KADELIQKGFVKVNGRIVTELGTKVKPNDKISVSGKTVSTEKKFIYIILNKPKDYITTTDDEFDRKTVLDIVKTHDRIFPVGRLDRNTTGLLLLTNDGEMTFRLTHPKYKVEKVYSAGLDRELKFSDAKKLSEGVELDDGITAPCQLLVDPKNKTHIILTLYEGKNHEVKRMFEALGYQVKKLERKMFAGLDINGLKRGEYRKLTKNEINSLKKMTGLV
ncbi:rRNA pseudouridine synthase, partial [Bacteroidetes/Chlorobi group bacterium ChocPot_Mid]